VKTLLIIITNLLLINLGCRKLPNNISKNELNISLSAEVDTLDPARSYDTVSSSVVYQIYEQLFEYHYLKRPYTIQPLLAESMPIISNDKKTYTIKIKKNIQYHPNKAFNEEKRFVTSNDFINQIKRIAFTPTRSRGWWLFDEKIVGLNQFRETVGSDLSKFNTTSVEGLIAPDDHTLIIKLTIPYPQMLFALAMSFTSPIPIEAIHEYKNDLDRNTIGTGPFKLDHWRKLSSIKISRFEGYRDAKYPSQGDRLSNKLNLLQDSGKKIPFLNAVHFNIMKEGQTRWLNFRAKKIDLLSLPKDNYSSAIGKDGSLTDELIKDNIQLQKNPTTIFWWISFNMEDSHLGKNKILRNAILHAINTDRYIKLFTNSIGQKANSIYPPGINGYNPSNQLPYSYSIEKAKKLLTQAGFPKGKGLPTLVYDTRSDSTTARQTAEFFKGELAKIGIDIQISINTFPAFLEKARQGKLQLWKGGWAMDYPDAENILQLLITKNHPPGPNATKFSDATFDKYFEKLKIMPNGKEKSILMQKMENIINQEIPWGMLYYNRSYTLYHQHLKNYRQSDLITNYMKYLSIRNNK